MIRYSVNMEERVIEPDDDGKWVKYEAVANIETKAKSDAEKHVHEATKADHALLASQKQEIATLTSALELLGQEAKSAEQDQDATIQRQRFLLKAAKDRLKLLGHANNCTSRYGAVTADGLTTVNDCSCGLDAWIKESGLG